MLNKSIFQQKSDTIMHTKQYILINLQVPFAIVIPLGFDVSGSRTYLRYDENNAIYCSNLDMFFYTIRFPRFRVYSSGILGNSYL